MSTLLCRLIHYILARQYIIFFLSCYVFFSFFFFFSSRRRHTRFDCDWSSDVCSSDLGNGGKAAARRPGVRRDGRVARAAPAQSVLPDGAHERALLLRRVGLVVRRRHGPHALLWLRRRRAPFPCRLPRRAGALRRRLLPALQARVRRIFSAAPPRRAARHRRHLLRRLRRSRLRFFFSAHPRSGRSIPNSLYADPGAQKTSCLRGARKRVSGLPARPLRGIQPGVRPRHAVRPAVGRARRIDPDVAAAARRVALRLETRARLAGRKALHRLPQAQRLDLEIRDRPRFRVAKASFLPLSRPTLEIFEQLSIELLIRLKQPCEGLLVSSEVPDLANFHANVIVDHVASYPGRMRCVPWLGESVGGVCGAVLKDHEVLSWKFPPGSRMLRRNLGKVLLPLS